MEQVKVYVVMHCDGDFEVGTSKGTRYLNKHQCAECVRLLDESRELVDRSHRLGLTLAQKLELIRQAKELRAQAMSIG